jgi:hypothetical protein
MEGLDCVLMAIGRTPVTADLGLESAVSSRDTLTRYPGDLQSWSLVIAGPVVD